MGDPQAQILHRAEALLVRVESLDTNSIQEIIVEAATLGGLLKNLDKPKLTLSEQDLFNSLATRYETMLEKLKALQDFLNHNLPPCGLFSSPRVSTQASSAKSLTVTSGQGERKRTLSSPAHPHSRSSDDSGSDTNRFTVTVLIPIIAGRTKIHVSPSSSVHQIKLDLVKKLARSGIQNVRPEAYFIRAAGHRVLEESLLICSLVKDGGTLELIRPFEFEVNLLSAPFPSNLIISETMNVNSACRLLGKALNSELKGATFKLYKTNGNNVKEELDQNSIFCSFAVRCASNLELESDALADVPLSGRLFKIIYSPFDDIDKQKKTKIKSSFVYKQAETGKWSKKWIELGIFHILLETCHERDISTNPLDQNRIAICSKTKVQKGVVNLATFIDVTDSTAIRKKDKEEWFYFDLESDGKTFLFRVRDEASQKSWITAISDYCSLIRVEQMQDSSAKSPSQVIPRKKSLARSVSGKFGKDKVVSPQSISAPFMSKKLFSVSTDWKWSSDQNPLETFQFLEVLGVGACGKVLKAKHKKLEFILAVKIVAAGDKDLQEELESEMEILKRCRSEHVIAYYGTVLRETETWILMDYCGVGSVKDLIKMTSESLSESQCRYVILGTLKGLVYMHNLNILHLDIKAANILINEECVVKLADFGVSTVLGKTNEVLQKDDYVGSPLFMAPEVILKQPINNRADIWSLGITLIEMAQGRPPNLDINSIEKLPLLAARDPPTLKQPKKHTREFIHFISLFLVKNPADRPSALTLLSDPYIHACTFGGEILKELVTQCMAANLAKRVKIDEDTIT